MTTIHEAVDLSNAVKYKIHAVNSVTGVGRSANNNVFYDTFEEAEARVREYLRKPETTHGGFVIMQTIAIFKPVQAPVATYMVRDSGRIVEII